VIFREGEVGQEVHAVLRGEAAIRGGGEPAPVGVVRRRECLGEMALLSAAPHSATATARTRIEAAVLGPATRPN
jgi:CRP-like cAMP-binding protein